VAADHVEDSRRQELGRQLSEAERGDRGCLGRLSTIVLPVASAGPIFQIAINSG